MVKDEGKADRQALADQGMLGEEPSMTYLERVNGLDNVVRECMHISQGYAGIKSPSGKHYYASVLFTALCTRAVSLLTLVPHTPWASKLIEHWDYASVAGITRTILELRLAFHYICAERCSEEEWDCRWNVFNLHDCNSRRRMFEATGDSLEQVAGFDAQAEELRERIRANAFFQSLTPHKQKSLLHGQTAFLMPLEDIGERVGVEKARFRWLYVMLSSHVHGLPMSFYRIGAGDDERGRGLPSQTEESYTSLFLSFTMTLMVGARDELHELFEGLVPEQPEKSPTAPIPDVEAITDEMQIGETLAIHDDGSIRIEVTRESESAVTVVFVDVTSAQPVLRQQESEDKGRSLEWFDPFFWQVTINGAPATKTTFEELQESPYAFRVDVDAREVLFKT
ncbi:DUF5677 domain-containing protein [Pseudomonas syringae]|uniref:DUF5677 domain-containing protein n=1 Tax=Pseudomonas syringae TaxID=317 RepID=UPI001F0D89D4|nr:DUF5677 domain-containing protein [Pseudomonas syringae]MCH5489580.1 DUF5677 domain-containing protein [Pseudomonas syringae pv. syringae]MDO1460327.1 DUF5677 domain-containing protein [Pseudomonas syringae pv. syringae]